MCVFNASRHKKNRIKNAINIHQWASIHTNTHTYSSGGLAHRGLAAWRHWLSREGDRSGQCSRYPASTLWNCKVTWFLFGINTNYELQFHANIMDYTNVTLINNGSQSKAFTTKPALRKSGVKWGDGVRRWETSFWKLQLWKHGFSVLRVLGPISGMCRCISFQTIGLGPPLKLAYLNLDYTWQFGQPGNTFLHMHKCTTTTNTFHVAVPIN